ncbi:MAG: hypothetical protein KC646_16220 [Candidatus Cloacimonetes bacterium]|nr:hypothetical protein [Candidatus Cloacimonadota bacterium]
MKVLILLILSTFLFGCFQNKSETPKQRFDIFIRAIQSNQIETIEKCLNQGTYEYLQANAGVFDPEETFIKRLIKDTKKSNPSYLSTEWILRNKIAKVNYTYLHNKKDFLYMEKKEKQWHINLFQKEKYKAAELSKFQVKK